jgi:FixJ family two-component response regulator
LIAEDYDKAAKLFTDNKDKIDLLILDAVMPKKGGTRVFDVAVNLKPGVKAIVMSGCTGEFLKVFDIKKEGINFIQKPTHPNEFIDKVKEEMERGVLSS